MKSVWTKEFRELFAQLPRDVQKQAVDTYRIFKENPYHPSIHFKCINKGKSQYSVSCVVQRAEFHWRRGFLRGFSLWYFSGTASRGLGRAVLTTQTSVV